MGSSNDSGPSKRDYSVMLPPDAYEWIGKAVAQQFEMFNAKFDAMQAKHELALASIEAKCERRIAEVKDGKDGADGLNGKDGLNGIDGKDGLNGKDGEKGDRGDRGEPGEKGDPGIVSAEALADIHQGIWVEGKEYLRGQIVTWGGSLWLSLAKNADKPGEQNANWKLIVKRGRDGKDGKDGKDGPEGKQGPKGDKGEIGYA